MTDSEKLDKILEQQEAILKALDAIYVNSKPYTTRSDGPRRGELPGGG